MRLNTSFTEAPGAILPKCHPRLDGARPTRGAGVGIDSTAALHAHCSAIVAASVRAGRAPERSELDNVRIVAEKLARRGVALRDAQRAVHAAVSAGLAGRVGTEDGVDCAGVVDKAVLMMRIAEAVGNVVSCAYLEQCRSDVGSAGDRVAQLVEMMIADDPEARVLAERNGIEVAPEYDVVYVRFVAPSTDRGATHARTIDAAAVAAVAATSTSETSSSTPLMSLTVQGGTVLIPRGETQAIDDVVARLKALSGVDVLAATAVGAYGDIGSAVSHCRELVDLARSLDKEPRLYRTGDLALEYQLSRPGPGRSRLRSVLAPLDAYPELLLTLKTFVASEANRRASAKSLFVHPNTVDYRLKKIEQLTGVDPLSSAGLMSLHAALVVDCLARADNSGLSASGTIAAVAS